MIRTIAAAAALTAASLPMAAQAADTLQVVSGPTGQRGVQINFNGPLGQSFTAIDSDLTSFGFQFQTFNDVAGAPVTFTLRSGSGLTGAVVATRTLNLPTTLPARTGQFYDFDITGTTVTVGQQYTAVLSTASTRYGVALGPEQNIYTGAFLGGDAYTGGQAFFTPSVFGTLPFTATNDPSSIYDLNFEVTGFNPDATAAVPEPAQWTLVMGAIGMAGGALRRRRRASARTLAFA